MISRTEEQISLLAPRFLCEIDYKAGKGSLPNSWYPPSLSDVTTTLIRRSEIER